MRPIFHPSLVNGRYGDPTVYVETLFKTHSVLFDLGEIASLSPRKIRRVDQIFVSHAHIDHFIGFDHLLRLLVGHEKTVHLYGPAGFAERVYHKLQAYRWNLVESYGSDLVFVVSELETPNSISTRQFQLKKLLPRNRRRRKQLLTAYSVTNGPAASQPPSSSIVRPASALPCRKWPMSIFGRIVRPSAGFLSGRGCGGSNRPLWKAVRTII